MSISRIPWDSHSNMNGTSSTSPMSCSSFPEQKQHETNEDEQHDHPHSRNHARQYSHIHEETRVILKEMRRLEKTTYRRPLVHELPCPFNGLWRQQIVEWMYTLVKYCNLRHESAAAAAFYLDAAVSRGLIHSPNDYQLGAMTALYLALKVYDSPCMRVVKLSSLVKLGNGEFKEEDILQMERLMVKLLGWRLNPPTANCFLQQYLTLLPRHDCNPNFRENLEELACQTIELAMTRDYFQAVPPSIIGYSALLMAIETVEQQNQQCMSLLDLQSFLCNMQQVAKLDNSSPCLVQTSVLLYRTMNSLPIPVAFTHIKTLGRYERELSNDSRLENINDCQGKNHHQDSSISTIGDVQFLDTVACEDGHSPNHVVMQ